MGFWAFLLILVLLRVCGFTVCCWGFRHFLGWFLGVWGVLGRFGFGFLFAWVFGVGLVSWINLVVCDLLRFWFEFYL